MCLYLSYSPFLSVSLSYAVSHIYSADELSTISLYVCIFSAYLYIFFYFLYSLSILLSGVFFYLNLLDTGLFDYASLAPPLLSK